jgi:hypothetical protein
MVHASNLVVAGRENAKMDCGPPIDSVDRNQEATVEFGAIGRDGIDFIAGVGALDVAVGPSARGVAADRDDVVSDRRPFALDAKQPCPKAEDEVIAATLETRPIDVHTEFQGRSSYRQLGNRALLIGAEHVVQLSNAFGWAMAVANILR